MCVFHIFEHLTHKKKNVLKNVSLRIGDKHITTKIKINVMVGLTRQSFSYLGNPLFKKIFTAFLRPYLEYGQAILASQCVHRGAAKLVDGYKN